MNTLPSSIDTSATSSATSSASPSAADVHAVARGIGFRQCVQALRRTLRTTPLGWALVAWIAWARTPHLQIGLWLAGFGVAWLVSQALLRRVDTETAAGVSTARPEGRLVAAAALDGIGWGATAWLLTGFDPTLDAWLGAVLCGVAAINAPVYITFIRAYRVLLGAMWLSILVALLRPAHDGRNELVVGMTIFCGLLAVYMQSIAHRVLQGIELQLSNASLAAQLNEALKLVRREAETDPLTGQPNRRALDALLKQQAELARVGNRTFSLLLLDIDHFKLINDTHGHGVGDDTLRAFAERVRAYLRQGDVCARYGGEEFVVVLPGTTLVAALEVAERLRHGVAEALLMNVPAIRATVSIGAAQFIAGERPEQLLERADRAVYEAKRGGRNQVRVLAPEPVLAP